MSQPDEMGFDHSPPALHLSMQSLIGVDGAAWRDKSRAISENDTCSRVFHEMPECSGELCGRRKSTPDGEGRTTEANLLCMPLMVWSEIHQENTILAKEFTTDNGREGVQLPERVCA